VLDSTGGTTLPVTPPSRKTSFQSSHYPPVIIIMDQRLLVTSNFSRFPILSRAIPVLCRRHQRWKMVRLRLFPNSCTKEFLAYGTAHMTFLIGQRLSSRFARRLGYLFLSSSSSGCFGHLCRSPSLVPALAVPSTFVGACRRPGLPYFLGHDFHVLSAPLSCYHFPC
jgi:hypothetical protein